MMPEPMAFATEWIEAWNSHDLDRILSHYSDDVEISTPMLKITTGVGDGTARGKVAVRQYWAAALRKMPDLRFQFVDCAMGIDSIAVYYKSVLGKMAIEVMFFDTDGKVCQVMVHYT